ncbi:MAG: hypothetical protein ACRDZ3_02380 [Acidimicrobiia bacterium]
MRLVVQSIGFAYVVAAAALTGGGLSPERFLLLLLPLGGYVALALRLNRGLPERAVEERPAGGRQSRDGSGLASAVGRLRADPALRRLAELLAITELLGPPLLVTYLIDVAGVRSSTAITLALVRQVASLVTLPLFGRAVDRHGPERVARTALVAIAALSTTWVLTACLGLLTDRLLLLGLLILGLALAMNAVSLAILALAHERIPPSEAGVAFSLYDLVESSVAQLLAIFGGMLITVAGRGGQVSFAGVGVDVYTLWMAAGAVMAGLAVRLAR